MRWFTLCNEASRYPGLERAGMYYSGWRVQGTKEQAGTRKEVDGQALQELKIYS